MLWVGGAVVNKDVRYKLTTLTPLWTGGVSGRCDRLHETGIIGSLRWWYEAVVRGLGGEACDPREHKCDFKVDEFKKNAGRELYERLRIAGLCDACQVFGATGWQRQFKVILFEKVQDLMSSNRFLPSLRLHVWGAGGWYIVPGKMGFVIVNLGFEEKHFLLPAVLSFMENWTAIGAKANSGYGVFTLEEVDGDKSEKVSNLVKWPEKRPFSNNFTEQQSLPYYPRLTNFFFAKVRFKLPNHAFFGSLPQVAAALRGKVEDIKIKNPLRENDMSIWLNKGCFPLSPVIRNWLRYDLFKSWGRGPKGNFIFGTSRKVCPRCYVFASDEDSCSSCHFSYRSERKPLERIRSKIGISHVYRIGNKKQGGKDELWEFRIWGYIPLTNTPIDAKERDGIFKNIKRELQGNGKLWTIGPLKGASFAGLDWREFSSARDTVRQFSDPWDFFKSLVEGGDGR
jgi:CRISPR-associated protein Cmr1